MKIIKTLKLLWQLRKMFNKAAADGVISIAEITNAIEEVCKKLKIDVDKKGIVIRHEKT